MDIGKMYKWPTGPVNFTTIALLLSEQSCWCMYRVLCTSMLDQRNIEGQSRDEGLG